MARLKSPIPIVSWTAIERPCACACRVWLEIKRPHDSQIRTSETMARVCLCLASPRMNKRPPLPLLLQTTLLLLLFLTCMSLGKGLEVVHTEGMKQEGAVCQQAV